METWHLGLEISRRAVVSVTDCREARQSQDWKAPLDLATRDHWCLWQSGLKGEGPVPWLKSEQEATLEK